MTTEIEGGLLDWDERNAAAAPYVQISNVSKAYDTCPCRKFNRAGS